MKKILSFVLVLAMIASMMCISVSATGANTNTGNNAQDIVGAHKGQGETGAAITDGVDKFAPTSNGGTVDATLTAVVNNRYAVELVYQVANITISGDATWDVNALVYDNNLEYKTDYMDAKTSLPDSADIQVANFTVTNFSDLGVNVTLTADISKITAAGANIQCLFQITGENTKAASVTNNPIAGAYNDNSLSGEVGTAKTSTYNAYLACTEWAKAFTDLKNANPTADQTAITVAAITIKVAPQNSNHELTQPQG